MSIILVPKKDDTSYDLLWKAEGCACYGKCKKFRKKNEWMRSIESFEKSYYELEYILSLDFMAPQRNT